MYDASNYIFMSYTPDVLDVECGTSSDDLRGSNRSRASHGDPQPVI